MKYIKLREKLKKRYLHVYFSSAVPFDPRSTKDFSRFFRSTDWSTENTRNAWFKIGIYRGDPTKIITITCIMQKSDNVCTVSYFNGTVSRM